MDEVGHVLLLMSLINISDLLVDMLCLSGYRIWPVKLL